MNLATPLPPQPPEDYRLRIIRVPGTSPYRIRVAATRAATTQTHFVGGRTMPCTGDEKCESCAVGVSRKFEAYLAAQPETGGARVVLALPEGAWRQIQALLGPLVDGGMWGHGLEFLRTSHKRSALEVFDRGPLPSGVQKPRPVNTPVILKRAWFGRISGLLLP